MTERIDSFAREGLRMTNYCPESQCTPSRSALLTGRHAIRSGTHSVPIGSPGGWGLVAWEKTLGDLLTAGGYRCAAYGKWHVGEGAGRWPTDKGFEEWYGPARTYDEALWPTDPWYDPERDPVSRMLEMKHGDADVTEGEQLTLDVRRDCDAEYLRRAKGFIKRAAGDGQPFFVYFNHSLLHMPVIPREEFKGCSGQGDWADSLLELDADFGVLLDLLDELGGCRQHRGRLRRRQRPGGSPALARNARVLGGVVLRRRRGQPAHSVHRPLARPRSGRASKRRDHAHH
jgi:arylsulfatase